MLLMASRMVGPIKTKLGVGSSTHVDPRSVLVKVKVMWCHLMNANKTPLTEACKGRENLSVKRDKYGGQRPAGPRQ